MKVSVKDFNVTMDIRNNGMELDITDNNDQHLGDLVITKTKLIWCQGKTRSENGIAIKWEDFINYMENL